MKRFHQDILLTRNIKLTPPNVLIEYLIDAIQGVACTQPSLEFCTLQHIFQAFLTSPWHTPLSCWQTNLNVHQRVLMINVKTAIKEPNQKFDFFHKEKSFLEFRLRVMGVITLLHQYQGPIIGDS